MASMLRACLYHPKRSLPFLTARQGKYLSTQSVPSLEQTNTEFTVVDPTNKNGVIVKTKVGGRTLSLESAPMAGLADGSLFAR